MLGAECAELMAKISGREESGEQGERSFVELTMDAATDFGEFHFPGDAKIERVSGWLWRQGY
ncbi:hypothetical protein ACFVYA_33405 [Amycolatopsis sp. NPDC058278]|uniref:hypothetical protein n=1 Tax=Amycolatopsis sp. NPDC058278 TaxID=3346417 RepID=UPI0036DDF02C